MLVSFNPNFSKNNYNNSVNFKGENPFKKISSDAAAYNAEGKMGNGKIPKNDENIAFLNETIQKFAEKGKKTIVAILERAQKNWK